MTMTRYLIVNADDFGRSPGFNRGVIEAHERGIVTSASLMVRWPAAAEAAAYARRHPELSLGLHVDLGTWICEDGEWRMLYPAVAVDDLPAVTAEVWRQLDRFRALVGRDPTHVDSHQHVHLRPRIQPIVAELARHLGVPLRHFAGGIRYCGRFYGQTADGQPLPGVISVDGLIRILRALPPGIVELACHPGYGDIRTMYCDERAQEVAVLCDPRVRAALPGLGVVLASFLTLPVAGSRDDAPART